jgi:regulator of sigma E protease
MFISIIVFVLVLSILILVHELGHFIIARRSGIWVEEFGIGYPPRIWGKKIGDTIYSINALPIGGFVRLHGEQTEEGVTKPKEAFINKSKKTRVAVLTAGVIMNFLLAIICFSVVYTFQGVPRQTDKVNVLGIAPGSPAESAGIKEDEVITSVDGKTVSSIDEFTGIVEDNKGKEVTLGIITNSGQQEFIKIIPRVNPPVGEGPLGVAISQTEIYFPPLWQRPFIGIYYGFQEAFYWGRAVLGGLGVMLYNLFKGVVPKDVTGPVGIYAITSEVSKFGILSIINFLGIFSVNLAIINILPFPALDGGRLLFIVVEKITGKKVVPKVEAAIHTIGMVVLLILMVAISYLDARRLIAAGGSISGFLENAVK